MVDLIKVVNAVKGKLMPSKMLADTEGQKVVDEHYKTFSKTDIVAVDEIDRRQNICNTCDNKTQYFALDMCNDMCFLKLKTASKDATCPMDKW
tara:strand:+ start:1931 stop:2209 length:279 start_codon:yes stop_codon:yes gene_type:complete